jgi:tricorn protease
MRRQEVRVILSILVVALLATFAGPVSGQVDARMLRYPDVSTTHISFVYAGDIWVVAREGGVAHRLSSPPGEEMFPRFSPDGSQIAYTANYDGNGDIYTIPTMGGTPKRLTHHGLDDRMLDWYPDGKSILYASPMKSGRMRFRQFHRLPLSGGLPEALPIAYGEFGAISPDGKTLAFMPISRDFRTWKRYRGGTAPDIFLFDLAAKTARNITDNVANDAQPMWHGQTLYFLSDRDKNQRNNIWAYSVETGEVRQITNFDKFDIHFPAIGPDHIVFQAGSRIYLLDLATEKTSEVEIEIVTDELTTKPYTKNVSSFIHGSTISPQGKRVMVEARGDIFSIPAEHGVIRNLTMTSGIAERFPAWSPDGKMVAYWSDRSGENELTIRDLADGSEERKLTSYGSGFRYSLYWSPDSKKLVFVDNTMTISIYDLEKKKTIKVDKALWMYEGALRNFSASWSSDSRWLTYSRGLDNRHRAVFLYDTSADKRFQVSSGYYEDFQPVFDPDGKYIYFLSNRTYGPIYSDVDNKFIYANTTNVVAVSLRADVPSPLAPRNDEDEIKKDEEKGKEDDKDKKDKKDEDKKDDKDKKDEVKPVEITIEDFERRLVVLPAKAGNYYGLGAVSGKVLYMRAPRTGSGDEEAAFVYYDLEEREEKTVLGDIDGYTLSADGKKALVEKDRSLAIVDIKPDQKMDKKLATGGLEAVIDPRSEWTQIFNDAWRIMRDYFYDPGMHGVNWVAMRKQYGALINDAATRMDVNFVIGELIGELNSSHTYRRGGDTERAATRGVGYLGVDWALKDGAYQVAKIIDGAEWDSEVRSPLAMPGVEINEGDFVLAVNGIALDTSRDPWAAFQGLAGTTVELTINDKPSMKDARKVIVETLESEVRLRHLAWIEANRKRVSDATDGRIGYIYVRDTGYDGQSELVRQFAGQWDKAGLIIDERFNSGGQIPDRFIEMLNRKPLAFFGVRDGADWQVPYVACFGPKVMLINGWSGSGGDAFPDYFKTAGVGPLVGTRTWGGLIGYTGVPEFVDNGAITVPTFRMFEPDGSWFPEGYGVDPDIEVKEDYTDLARGIDTQLEAAIAEVLKMLPEGKPGWPKRPAYEKRTAR